MSTRIHKVYTPFLQIYQSTDDMKYYVQLENKELNIDMEELAHLINSLLELHTEMYDNQQKTLNNLYDSYTIIKEWSIKDKKRKELEAYKESLK